jgi:hypothetical protein
MANASQAKKKMLTGKIAEKANLGLRKTFMRNANSNHQDPTITNRSMAT